MTAIAPAPAEVLRHEYSEAALSFRHYSALRFVIFSIYVGIIAALGGVALGVIGSLPPTSTVARAAAVGALLITYVFWTCETACLRDRQHYRNVMRRLEGPLGYDSVTSLPRETLIRPAIAFKVLFATSFLFWIFLLVYGRL
jgi:hypothetical protein